MNKLDLENYIGQGFSSRRISATTNKSQTTVMHWLKKFGLKTTLKSFKELPACVKIINGDRVKTCPKCKQTKNVILGFYISKKNRIHGWCKDCNNRITCQKIIDRKKQCIEYKGGKCYVCGYNRYAGSMDFHHVDPSKKEFNISNLKTYALVNIKKELDKCILLCRNCHGEVHAGLIDLKL